MTTAFNLSVGPYGSIFEYGDFRINAKIRLKHRHTFLIKLGTGTEVPFGKIGVIEGSTPKTYHSGNRPYGKIIFSLPETYTVVETVYKGSSNKEAADINKSFFRTRPYNAETRGYDIYRLEKFGDEYGESWIEIPQKVEIVLSMYYETDDFRYINDAEYMEDSVFWPHALPYNLNEVPGLEYWPWITQGWNTIKNEDVHLFAVTWIGGYNTFIPFASTKEQLDYSLLPSNVIVDIKYLKCINKINRENTHDEELPF